MSSIRAFGLCLFLVAAIAPAQTTVKWKPVKGGAASNATGPSQTVLHNEGEFDAYWAKNFGDAKKPKIAWANSQLVAIHMGHRGSRAYSANIYSVVERDGETVVTWFERIPSRKTAMPPRASSPYVIVSIPATNSPVTFKSFVNDPSNPYSNGDAFPVRKLLSGGHSFIKKEASEMVDQSSTLAELWKNAFGRAATLPKTDFANWRYAAIFLGQRPTPGYNIVIQRIARIGPTEVQIIYTETKPAKDAIEPQMVTNPFVILQLPKTNDDITITRGS